MLIKSKITGKFVKQRFPMNCGHCGKFMLVRNFELKQKNKFCSKFCHVNFKKINSKPPIYRGTHNPKYNPDFHILEKTACSCGCGGFVEHSKARPRKFIQGHNTTLRTPEEKLNQIKKAHAVRVKYFQENQRITPLYKLIKVSKKYISWRKSVFERDGYKCCDCGIGGYIEAHHIKPFAIIYRRIFNPAVSLDENYENCLNNDELFDLNNGKTLCKNCHKKQYHAHYIARVTVAQLIGQTY